jgi:hypothetical protein
MRWSFWLHPLPTNGPIVLSCQWPGRGIEDGRFEVDAGDLDRAAATASELWPVPDLALPKITGETVVREFATSTRFSVPAFDANDEEEPD